MIFNKKNNRINTDSVKWDTLESHFGRSDIYPMWIADTEFEPPKEFFDAINKKMEQRIFGYNIVGEELKTVLHNFCHRRFNLDVPKDNFIFTPGVMCAVTAAIRVYSNMGDGITINTPNYTPFFKAIDKNNRIYLGNKLLINDGDIKIDFVDLEEKLKVSKIFLLSNPQNPTGMVYNYEELKKIATLCEKYNVFIISDEIHRDIVFKGNEHITISEISDYTKHNSLTCFAPSKTFNIPGLTASVSYTYDREIYESITEELNSAFIDPENTFSQGALLGCYSNADYYIDDLVTYLEENLLIIEEELLSKLKKIKYVRPQSTYLLWLDFSEYGSMEEVKERLINKAKVALSPGRIYGEYDKSYFRMNYGTQNDTLRKLCQQIYMEFKED